MPVVWYLAVTSRMFLDTRILEQQRKMIIHVSHRENVITLEARQGSRGPSHTLVELLHALQAVIQFSHHCRTP